jgi:hypothetical protein
MLTNIDSIATTVLCVTVENTRDLIDSNECIAAIKLTYTEIHFFRDSRAEFFCELFA